MAVHGADCPRRRTRGHRRSGGILRSTNATGEDFSSSPSGSTASANDRARTGVGQGMVPEETSHD
ncbi:MAG: hypothetical protein ACLUYV_05225 [Alistipes shahii]